ncbi:C-terminal, D2-small domain-containing protein, of ClpB protein [Ectothiorhodosinus mongolicus]|uniref:C-terminal, D2-small domain-containing protein, of ClpB protein n=2 Tax=Ectothiorhodosinus mongolicus TaxID=233100 RepID=A0A1R3W501_9GAMM|nr:ATP-dependent Clp protease ATP-binding subunit [Ectothiorhodosinus mongolicus]SIT72835.1 C-terminal, D2-small domain-containing protein, of ClpB protein [Ectothiorhodosinus mongolicus]
MPFLNDMLDQTARERADREALSRENAASEDVVLSHLNSDRRLESRFQFDLEKIMAHLRSEILGQEEALAAVEDSLKVVRADITDPRKPLFVSLFLGPTGVGKTEIIRSLARALHGDADAFCRVDMNTLSQEHYSAAITGAPPGYVGAKEGKTLFDVDKLEGARGRPGIVLFDELEKASAEVIQALLNIFDNGMLTVASGERSYSFRNTLIFMTSNLGAKDVQRFERQKQDTFWKSLWHKRMDRKDLVRIINDRLVETFSPEFINRIDNITIFNWISRDLMRGLIDIETQRLNKRLSKYRCHVELAEELIQHIAQEGFNQQFGARSLRRAMRRYLEVPFAEFLLTEHTPSHSAETEAITYRAHWNANAVRFTSMSQKTAESEQG